MRNQKERLGADVLFELAAALGVPTDHFKPFLAPDSAAEEPETPTSKKGGGKK